MRPQLGSESFEDGFFFTFLDLLIDLALAEALQELPIELLLLLAAWRARGDALGGGPRGPTPPRTCCPTNFAGCQGGSPPRKIEKLKPALGFGVEIGWDPGPEGSKATQGAVGRFRPGTPGPQIPQAKVRRRLAIWVFDTQWSPAGKSRWVILVWGVVGETSPRVADEHACAIAGAGPPGDGGCRAGGGGPPKALLLPNSRDAPKAAAQQMGFDPDHYGNP